MFVVLVCLCVVFVGLLVCCIRLFVCLFFCFVCLFVLLFVVKLSEQKPFTKVPSALD